MNNRLRFDRTLGRAAVLCCIFGAGCATVEPTMAPAPAATPVPAAPVEPPAPVAAAQNPPTSPGPIPPAPPKAATSPKPAPAVPAKPPAAVAAAPAPVRPVPVPPVAATKPAMAPPVAAPKPGATKPEAPKVAVAKPAAAPLDLAALEVRLRETKAIGVMTKLSLKNQVDDLLDKFRAYYKRQAKTSLAELRRPYDMLLLKVLSLLQDSDPPLAKDIVASREAIWGILADPEKFNEAKLMAGETP